MKCVSRAWGPLKRGFEVLALGEICMYVCMYGRLITSPPIPMTIFTPYPGDH